MPVRVLPVYQYFYKTHPRICYTGFCEVFSSTVEIKKDILIVPKRLNKTHVTVSGSVLERWCWWFCTCLIEAEFVSKSWFQLMFIFPCTCSQTHQSFPLPQKCINIALQTEIEDLTRPWNRNLELSLNMPTPCHLNPQVDTRLLVLHICQT